MPGDRTAWRIGSWQMGLSLLWATFPRQTATESPEQSGLSLRLGRNVKLAWPKKAQLGAFNRLRISASIRSARSGLNRSLATDFASAARE